MIIGNAVSDTLFALDLIGERQKVLSSNIANMDTPGYKRKDVSFSQYMGGASGSLETALSVKMGPCPVINYETGGKVDPASELSEMKKNQLLYAEAARRMTSIITEMRQAVSMGNG